MDEDNFPPDEVWPDGYKRVVGPSKNRPVTKPSAVKSSSVKPGKKEFSINEITRSSSKNAQGKTVKEINEHHAKYPKKPNQYRPLIKEGKYVIEDAKYVGQTVFGPSTTANRFGVPDPDLWVTGQEKAYTQGTATVVQRRRNTLTQLQERWRLIQQDGS